ncbi:hypothetical protein PGTUg99_005020 [Puccinia graminis f. sp. tritici]|uniref:Uncharacterized protein n=1 Tax=Puccinia graminis f. sp. tritici TaxID=56615 RepID=A0A5B0NIM3_PUCGR|nr:hypothetical protein PGTUg99_005020 [Puccinia graminis f. sp. tritici]
MLLRIDLPSQSRSGWSYASWEQEGVPGLRVRAVPARKARWIYSERMIMDWYLEFLENEMPRSTTGGSLHTGKADPPGLEASKLPYVHPRYWKVGVFQLVGTHKLKLLS